MIAMFLALCSEIQYPMPSEKNINPSTREPFRSHLSLVTSRARKVSHWYPLRNVYSPAHSKDKFHVFRFRKHI